MKYRAAVFFVYTLLLLSSIGLAHAADVVHHRIKLQLIPQSSQLIVEDRIALPESFINDGVLYLLLHAQLSVSVDNATIEKQEVSQSEFLEMAKHAGVPLVQYQISMHDASQPLLLKYQGKIHHVIKGPGEEYARSFSETPGIISDEGVFLANSSAWFPRFADKELVTFDLTIEVPQGWGAVSQGELVKDVNSNDSPEKQTRSVQWIETHPQDDIYVVASRYHEYMQDTAVAKAMVYMRKQDDALAQKYLDATAQYLSMYTTLLGPYPYKKFALVENFWSTGYGMPSFTLLGPKVIRFPFIIHSSYPHEILHNYWGNGVYVDYERGNWAEGLTAYLADHLIKEQRGKAAEYRRDVLQKYTDFVNSGRDFPLIEFRSRHSSATEAVGYGKTMMLFHMLRMQLGDKVFVRSLRRFYKEYQFKYATFSDVKSVFSEVADIDLSKDFEQWVEQAGAPRLEIAKVEVKNKGNDYQLALTLVQQQEGSVYKLEVPVVIYVQDQSQAREMRLNMQSRQQAYEITLPGKPLRVEVDPQFDVFRRLDSREIPSALSQGFGDEKPLMVLPEKETAERLSEYRKLAKHWQASQNSELEVVMDSQLKQLPSDRSVWLLGWNNRFRQNVVEPLQRHGVRIKGKEVQLKNKSYNSEDHALLLTARNRNNINKTVLWLSSGNSKAVAGLANKLPHYRKYSYLMFAGDAPDNVDKGQWDVLDSPMNQVLDESARTDKITLASRRPLIELPPVFSVKHMMEDIRYLADANKKGRGLGSKELDEVAQYIADSFKAAGLQPGGDVDANNKNVSYFQTWQEDVGEPLGSITLKNIIGVLPGTNPALAGQSLVISAHYDHLGTGWPDVHKGDEGKIHYGADDNASGVAVMLEFARQVAKKWKPERAIVFVAFSAEEAALRGSKYYVQHAQKYPANKTFTAINLDTVGRLNDNPLTIFGANSASELVHVFRGAFFVTGIAVKPVMNDLGTSDQTSFLNIGVPAVQLFASAHEDFHRPGDTIDKIDSAGLIKVATILKEAAEYLSNRTEPLTVQIDKSKQVKRPKSKRKVSLGSIPDFAYQGDGVRLDGVIAGSPAEKAGLKKGDILKSINQKTIKDLGDLSAALGTLKPGDTIEIELLRDRKKQTVQATVEKR